MITKTTQNHVQIVTRVVVFIAFTALSSPAQSAGV